jgi:hypothetical protein
MPMPQSTVREGYELQRPNRERAASHTMRATVVLLLLVSVALMAIVTVGGWSASAGMQWIQIIWIGVYLVGAYTIAGWSRGALPMMAAAAVLLAIFAAVAGVSWLDRDAFGFAEAALPAGLLGMLTLLLIPVQALLVVSTLIAFNQNWNVEVEVPIGERYDADRHGPAKPGRPAPAA